MQLEFVSLFRRFIYQLYIFLLLSVYVSFFLGGGGLYYLHVLVSVVVVYYLSVVISRVIHSITFVL